jgi:hypothetical protein
MMPIIAEWKIIALCHRHISGASMLQIRRVEIA